MTNPETQALLLPLLQLVADGQATSTPSAVAALGETLKLTQNDRDERLASGKRLFNDRVSRARRYLIEAGLLQSVGRAQFQITPAGQALLATQPKTLDLAAIRAFNESFSQSDIEESDLMDYPELFDTEPNEIPSLEEEPVTEPAESVVEDTSSFEDDNDGEPLRHPGEDAFDAFVRHQKRAVEEFTVALNALIPDASREHSEASLKAFTDGIQVVLDGADDVLNDVADIILGPWKSIVDQPDSHAAPIEEPMEREDD